MADNHTQIKGVHFFKDFTKKHPDSRGFFMELFKESKLDKLGLPRFKQINTSFSKKNVIRGLHYQNGDSAQGKLVQCLSGHILDVVVDIDPSSPTFKKVETFRLVPGQGAVYIPPHLAHGFWALEDSVLLYACTEEYSPNNEGGISPLDKGLDLPWLKQQESFIISEKDRKLPFL